MKNKFKAQLGPRGIVTWIVTIMLLAGLLPALMSQINITIPLLDTGSPERFLWSLLPFFFVVGAAAALLSAFLPQRDQPQGYQ